MSISQEQLAYIFNPGFPAEVLAKSKHDVKVIECSCPFCKYKKLVKMSETLSVMFLQIGSLLLDIDEIGFTSRIIGCLIYIAKLENGQALFIHSSDFDAEWVRDPALTQPYGGIINLKVMGGQTLMRAAPNYHLKPSILKAHKKLKRVEYVSTPYTIGTDKSALVVNAQVPISALVPTHADAQIDLELKTRVTYF